MTAANALLQAIHAALAGDPALAAMLSSDGIRDRKISRPKLPAIVFGELETRDASTATEPGEEHFLTIEIWSDAQGRRQVQEIAARVDALLDDAALPLTGFALISLLRVGIHTGREPETAFYLSEMRFRAVTE